MDSRVAQLRVSIYHGRCALCPCLHAGAASSSLQFMSWRMDQRQLWVKCVHPSAQGRLRDALKEADEDYAQVGCSCMCGAMDVLTCARWQAMTACLLGYCSSENVLGPILACPMVHGLQGPIFACPMVTRDHHVAFDRQGFMEGYPAEGLWRGHMQRALWQGFTSRLFGRATCGGIFGSGWWLQQQAMGV
eukprot:1159878-Pelagomonas_calceolata.AAC.8